MLDLGCGQCILSVYGAAKSMKVVAIDKKRHPQDLTENIPNITFFEKDLTTFLPDGRDGGTSSLRITLCSFSERICFPHVLNDIV